MQRINSMTVLYDAQCAFCQRCKRWLEQQPLRINLHFLPYESPLVEERFPDLNRNSHIELTTITDKGDVYYSDKAFIMCLYATYNYHFWSEKLANPLFRPLVRNAYEYLSRFRHKISRLFSLEDQHALQQLQLHVPTEYCEIKKDN